MFTANEERDKAAFDLEIMHHVYDISSSSCLYICWFGLMNNLSPFDYIRLMYVP